MLDAAECADTQAGRFTVTQQVPPHACCMRRVWCRDVTSSPLGSQCMVGPATFTEPSRACPGLVPY